jgi:hypothetical protein
MLILSDRGHLEGLGQAQVQDGNPGHAAAHLQLALAIYRRIGAPDAQRVQDILRTHSSNSGNSLRPAVSHPDLPR